MGSVRYCDDRYRILPMNFWNTLEQVTGIKKEMVQGYVKGVVEQHNKRFTCVCGKMLWEHGKQDCQCKKFVSVETNCKGSNE